jgi:hypothetical protein
MNPDENSTVQPIDGALLAQVTPIPSEPVTHAEGSATIKQDENTVIIKHGLAARPSVTIKGIPDHFFSFIVNDDAESFQVCLHVPATEDIPFHWTADI